MKKFALLLLPLMLLFACNNNKQQTEKSSATQAQEQKQQAPMLVGKVTRSDFMKEPYKDWFQKGYDSYQLDTVTLDSIKGKNFTMTIVLGTWCPDSRRNVPRMFKIIDYLQIPDSNLTIICVDRDKKAGDVDISSLNIQRIPTFIIYLDGQEKGRIVENPKQTLEIDLKNILK